MLRQNAPIRELYEKQFRSVLPANAVQTEEQGKSHVEM